jgi:hypothetical protein
VPKRVTTTCDASSLQADHPNDISENVEQVFLGGYGERFRFVDLLWSIVIVVVVVVVVVVIVDVVVGRAWLFRGLRGTREIWFDVVAQTLQRKWHSR